MAQPIGAISGAQTAPADRTGQHGGGQTGMNAASSPDTGVSKAVRRLKAVERKVRAHERAHKAASGQYAGAVSYSYTRGPDGKRYVTGGEVAIDVSPEQTPEATIRKMQQVRRAALEPADPSPQDRAVAAQAQATMLQARAELARGTNATPQRNTGSATESIIDITV